jgi:multidrug resistance efflux pump
MTEGTDAPATTDRSSGQGTTVPTHEPALPRSAAFEGLAAGAKPSPQGPGHLRQVARLAATLLTLGAAAVAALAIWNLYVTAPWTRDGRVRVQVAAISPQISGQIVEVRVVDDQFVHKGDVLYVIEQFDYRVALATASALVRQRAADAQVKRRQAERRLHLTDLSTTAEEQQVYVGQAAIAQAAFEAAEQQQAQAQINLARTEVRTPVNGFVSNLLMRVGDYAHVGVTNMSVIDTDSYWIDGYFEETKLARLCVGDRVEARLMGYRTPVMGRIDTVTRGISVSDASPSTQGLPNVNPVYTWVRLAQRVPVRIRITQVPPDVPLIAGLSATVVDREGEAEPNGALVARAYARLIRGVGDVFGAPPRAPGCIPPTMGGSGAPADIPEPILPAPASSGEITPGLAPGLRARPAGP